MTFIPSSRTVRQFSENPSRLLCSFARLTLLQLIFNFLQIVLYQQQVLIRRDRITEHIEFSSEETRLPLFMVHVCRKVRSEEKFPDERAARLSSLSMNRTFSHSVFLLDRILSVSSFQQVQSGENLCIFPHSRCCYYHKTFRKICYRAPISAVLLFEEWKIRHLTTTGSSR